MSSEHQHQSILFFFPFLASFPIRRRLLLVWEHFDKCLMFTF